MGSWHTEVPSPSFAAFIDFGAQAKLARFEGADASTLHTPPVDATGAQGMGV